MNQHTYRKNFVVGAVAVAVVAGVAAGFFIAHSITGEIGTGAVSTTSVWANEMEDMKQTDMKGMSMPGMPGMSAAPSVTMCNMIASN